MLLALQGENLIPFEQVINFLNYESRSRLLQVHKDLILAMRRCPEPTGLKICNDLLLQAYQKDPPCDYAEVVTYCATYLYKKGRITEALGHFIAAVGFYEHIYDVHRQGIVEYLLYVIVCPHGNPEQAFQWAHKSFFHLLDRANFYHRSNNNIKLKWYKEQMTDIAKDMLSSPKTTLDCMFVFDGSNSDPSATLIKNRIDQFMRRGDTRLASKGLNYLKKKSRNSAEPRETAESLAFSGVKLLEMNNPKQAIADLRRAIACCSPASHDQVFLRWILGLEQLKIESEWCSGIENLEMSIRHMETLARTADRQNGFYKRTWYEVYGSAMRGILNQRLENWTGRVRALPVACYEAAESGAGFRPCPWVRLCLFRGG